MAFRFGGGGEADRAVSLRVVPAAGRRGVSGAPEPQVEAVARQLSPWLGRLRPQAGAPPQPLAQASVSLEGRLEGSLEVALEVALEEGDAGRPLLEHLAEGAVLGLAGALGWRYIFPCTARCYEERELTRPAGLAAAQLEGALAGTGLAGLGEAFCQAESGTGINAAALAALAAWQSAWGNSRLAREWCNPLGWGVGPGPGGVAFASPAGAVAAVAPLIRRQYLTPGGLHYYGANLLGMNVDYAVDPQWRHGVAALWRQIEARSMS